MVLFLVFKRRLESTSEKWLAKHSTKHQRYCAITAGTKLNILGEYLNEYMNERQGGFNGCFFTFRLPW
jgi:hypothetical protein